jgi:predicted nucleic acid-binding protein
VRFWDASAVVPLLVAEAGSSGARALLADDPEMVVWWGTPVECTSSVARREREGLDPAVVAVLSRRLRALAGHWTEVAPTDALREDALRLLRVHPLRSADALQLAAALAVCRGRPSGFPFVCADARLRAAAAREGFDAVDPLRTR